MATFKYEPSPEALAEIQRIEDEVIAPPHEGYPVYKIECDCRFCLNIRAMERMRRKK